MGVRLSDLPAEVIEKLKPLSHEEFGFLGGDAYMMRFNEEQAQFPSDPKEAVQGAQRARRADATVTIDDPIEFAAAMAIVRGVAFQQGGAHGLDQRECTALWELANLTDDVLTHIKKAERELASRLRQVTHPVEK